MVHHQSLRLAHKLTGIGKVAASKPELGIRRKRRVGIPEEDRAGRGIVTAERRVLHMMRPVAINSQSTAFEAAHGKVTPGLIARKRAPADIKDWLRPGATGVAATEDRATVASQVVLEGGAQDSPKHQMNGAATQVRIVVLKVAVCHVQVPGVGRQGRDRTTVASSDRNATRPASRIVPKLTVGKRACSVAVGRPAIVGLDIVVQEGRVAGNDAVRNHSPAKVTCQVKVNCSQENQRNVRAAQRLKVEFVSVSVEPLAQMAPPSADWMSLRPTLQSVKVEPVTETVEPTGTINAPPSISQEYIRN